MPLPPARLSYQDVSLNFIELRPGDTPHIRLAAGHLGYEIHPQFRGHHYAQKACLAAAPWIATVIEKVILTTDLENLPSIRTIEKIGATFIKVIDVPSGDPHYERGSFQKRLYHWIPAP